MAMFRAGNAFSKKQQAPTAAPAPAPAASRRPLGGSKLPSMSRSAAPAVAPKTTRGVPTDNYGNLYIGTRRRQSTPVAPNSAAQAAAVNQFNQSQQAAMQQFNAPTAALQAAQQRSNPNMSIPMETMPSAPAAQTPSKAMQAYMAAEKAGTAGNMAKPAFRKGGAVKKKTGYAKGGAVMCGASMPPAQKGKK